MPFCLSCTAGFFATGKLNFEYSKGTWQTLGTVALMMEVTAAQVAAAALQSKETSFASCSGILLQPFAKHCDTHVC